jgi:hypothetical protein
MGGGVNDALGIVLDIVDSISMAPAPLPLLLCTVQRPERSKKHRGCLSGTGCRAQAAKVPLPRQPGSHWGSLPTTTPHPSDPGLPPVCAAHSLPPPPPPATQTRHATPPLHDHTATQCCSTCPPPILPPTHALFQTPPHIGTQAPSGSSAPLGVGPSTGTAGVTPISGHSKKP